MLSGMKMAFSYHRLMRVTAVVEALAGIAVNFVREGGCPGPVNVSSSVFTGLLLLSLYPSAHDNVRFGWHCCLVAAVCFGVVGYLPLQPIVAVLICSAVEVVLQVFMVAFRFSNVKSFISNMAVWHYMEDSERLVLSMASLLLALLLAATSGACAWVQWTVLAILVTAFALRYFQAYRNASVFFSKKRLGDVKRHLRGRVLPASPLRNDDETARINSLYDKVLNIMEEKSPYLDPELKISDLSAMLFTNKVYLSRTINVMSGMNYNQFINSYRVEYAKVLMKKDPRLQVQEVATMSGFQTTASMNMAFKLFQGMTPGQYGRIVSGHPSSSEGTEQ